MLYSSREKDTSNQNFKSSLEKQKGENNEDLINVVTAYNDRRAETQLKPQAGSKDKKFKPHATADNAFNNTSSSTRYQNEASAMA